MAIPADTRIFGEAMDPYDIVDFEIDITNLLEPGEGFTTYNLSVPTESDLLGLTIHTTDGYTTSVSGNIVKFWVGIDPSDQGNKAYDTGVTLPIEIRVTTDSTPPRKKQRTVAVKVIHR